MPPKMATSLSVVRGSPPLGGEEGLFRASMAPHMSINPAAINRNWPHVVPAKVTDAQLIQLKHHSSRYQQNAPEAALARHDIWDACANQKQRPESPQPVYGNNAHVIEEQGDSAQNQECAPKETAFAPAAPPSLISAPVFTLS